MSEILFFFGGGTLTIDFGVPSIEGGTVAFRADGAAGQEGVCAFQGGNLSKVADLNTPAPGTQGNFTLFLDCSD